MARIGKRRVLSAIIVVFSVLVVAAALQAAPLTVSLEDVVLLAQSGISDETILVFLDYREIGFELGPQEVLHLREAGVGEEVIRYLLERTGVLPEDGPVPLDYSYPSRYYATSYGVGAGYYLGASILPSWWWYDHHYLGLHGIYLGGHYQPAYHGLAGHNSFAGSVVHQAGHLTGGHLGRPVLAHRGGSYSAGHRTGVGHRSALGHTGRSAGHRSIGHARSGRSSGSHSRGHVGRSSASHGGRSYSRGHVGRSGGSHGGRSHGGGSHGGGSHGGGSHGGGSHGGSH